VEKPHNALDHVQLVFRHSKPLVESLDELASDLFSGVRGDVLERLQQKRFLAGLHGVSLDDSRAKKLSYLAGSITVL